MLTEFLILVCVVLFAAIVRLIVFAVELWREHRERKADMEQSLAILRANRFLQ